MPPLPRGRRPIPIDAIDPDWIKRGRKTRNVPETTDYCRPVHAVAYKIIGEQGLMYLLYAGENEHGWPLGRIYDRRRGLVGPVMLVGSIVNHAPGWEEPDLPDWLERQLLDEVSRLLAVAPGDATEK